ncbi:thiosulfate oxidation carrier complex protein SoxZ [Acidithiobacillus ferriphilus]|jgi:sulfur-oxidizing protein SoxZ|uniref:thiosulfate oxidation carrier complex protein SoxZ n=1 Tax=Acidithiobacillus ferriphilus TaxID=1689834 RepID=UPI00232B1F98|nr:thiosulfate oxidation carrier complex protein SoxZ [Acidithiobacillus ferriphilus]WCE93334.1 thiosulfate oxidation carrier complex protein SoxZ [Acidithiobacillus ferriphilus]
MSKNIGNPMIRMASNAKKGEIIEVRSLIMHPMSTGLMKDKAGKIIPAHIIQTVNITFNDKPLLDVDWSTAVSANPYLAFKLRAEDSGTLKMVWKDNKGGVWSADAKLTVA